MMGYKITEKKVLIYGAGSTGKILAERLLEQRIDVVGFIDTRANIITNLLGMPVYALEQIEHMKGKGDYAVILTVRNVFEHSKIANRLFDLGFYNLIFKPYSVLKNEGEGKINQISAAHDSFLVGFTVYNEKIPPYEQKELIVLQDKALIGSEGAYIIANVPAQLLFTNFAHGALWSEANFLTHYIAVQLYRALERCDPVDFENTIQDYIHRFAKPGAVKYGVNVDGTWENILVNSRMQSYGEMNKLFSLNYNFFVKNCTTVAFDSGRLKLVASGKNRVSFLIAKGMEYIPVKISKSDYHLYINIEQLRKLREFIEDNKIIELFAPIPHPYFYEFKYVAENYSRICIQKIGAIIAECLFKKYSAFSFQHLKVLDGLADQGAISRHLRMLGAIVYRSGTVELDLARLIDNLLGINGIENDDGKKTYDICLIDGNVPTQVAQSMLERTNEYCFLNYEEDREDIKQVIDANEFIVMKELYSTIWDDKLRKGVLYRKKV